MTFWQYFLYIDVPVSLVLFVMIVLIIKRVKAVRRLKSLEESNVAYDEVVQDTTNETTREFPVWLLERASFVQLDNYLGRAFRDDISFTYSHFSWNDLKRLLVKLNKLDLLDGPNGTTNSNIAAYYIEELRTYMNYWDAA